MLATAQTAPALPIALHRDEVDNSVVQAYVERDGVQLAADFAGRLALAASGYALELPSRHLPALRRVLAEGGRAGAVELAPDPEGFALGVGRYELPLSAAQRDALHALVQPPAVAALRRAARG